MKEQFVLPGKLKNFSFAMLGIGILTILIGTFALVGDKGSTRFWSVLLFDSVFFLLICAATALLMSAATLAQGSWHIAYKRVMEAMMMSIPVLGLVAFIVMMCIVWGDKSSIYPWADAKIVSQDPVLIKKATFLNPSLFTYLSALTIGLWAFLGYHLRKISLREDSARKGTTKFFWRAGTAAAMFVVVFAVTNSTSTWQWIMSIDVKWYSTLFAWYIFASSLVTGIAVLTLFVILLRNLGYLEWVTHEHLHDMGKLMFAFSIFYTYLWFAQYMLIWYANIPEETNYFQIRLWGSYHVMFYLVLIINFVSPFLILMSRDAKRKYTIVAFMAIMIFIGHFLDFYMMFMPGTVKDNWHIGWFEIGTTVGFIGLLIYLVTRNLSKAPLFPKNHPYLKETIIHHS